MAQTRDELTRFMGCAGTYPWKDFLWLLEKLGYEQRKAGKTGGSRRKFYNKRTGHLIMLDEPHDGEMRPGMVRRLQKEFLDRGLV